MSSMGSDAAVIQLNLHWIWSFMLQHAFFFQTTSKFPDTCDLANFQFIPVNLHIKLPVYICPNMSIHSSRGNKGSMWRELTADWRNSSEEYGWTELQHVLLLRRSGGSYHTVTTLWKTSTLFSPLSPLETNLIKQKCSLLPSQLTESLDQNLDH